MAFNLKNLSCIANNAKTGVVPAVWEYYNEGGDTITTAGYFPLTSGIRNKDRILVMTTSLAVEPAWYYAEVSSGVITVSACSTVPASITLDSLDDVVITTAANGNVLKYNGTKWVNDTLTIPTTLGSLTDVTITEVADGDALTYDSTSTKWVNTASGE